MAPPAVAVAAWGKMLPLVTKAMLAMVDYLVVVAVVADILCRELAVMPVAVVAAVITLGRAMELGWAGTAWLLFNTRAYSDSSDAISQGALISIDPSERWEILGFCSSG